MGAMGGGMLQLLALRVLLCRTCSQVHGWLCARIQFFLIFQIRWELQCLCTGHLSSAVISLQEMSSIVHRCSSGSKHPLGELNSPSDFMGLECEPILQLLATQIQAQPHPRPLPPPLPRRPSFKPSHELILSNSLCDSLLSSMFCFLRNFLNIILGDVQIKTPISDCCVEKLVKVIKEKHLYSFNIKINLFRPSLVDQHFRFLAYCCEAKQTNKIPRLIIYKVSEKYVQL